MRYNVIKLKIIRIDKTPFPPWVAWPVNVYAIYCESISLKIINFHSSAHRHTVRLQLAYKRTQSMLEADTHAQCGFRASFSLSLTNGPHLKNNPPIKSIDAIFIFKRVRTKWMTLRRTRLCLLNSSKNKNDTGYETQ